MKLALRKPMTLAEFLDWELRQEFRYEFDGFQPVAMTGGTRAHAAIKRNLAVSLTGRLREKSGNFLGSDLKIEAAGQAHQTLYAKNKRKGRTLRAGLFTGMGLCKILQPFIETGRRTLAFPQPLQLSSASLRHQQMPPISRIPRNNLSRHDS